MGAAWAARWLLVATVVLVALMRCSVASADFFTQDTIQRFSPLLVMYAEEDNGPSSAPWFLDRSLLRFAERKPCRDETVYDGPWTNTATRKLGLLVGSGSRWRYQTKEFLCHRSGPVFLVTDYTRPYKANRPPGLHRGEGFYLKANLDQGGKSGMSFTKATGGHEFVTDSPIYYDDGELFSPSGSAKSPRQAYISYWFFYPYNDAPGGGPLFNHQGDWENITLLFQQDAPGSLLWTLDAVSYSAHGSPKAVGATCSIAPPGGTLLSCPVPRTKWQGSTRLVGFVADGDHATYPTSGRHRLRPTLGLVSDHTSSIASGFSWPTWESLLPLESQGWAGFCGAWGLVGAISDGTGPDGPGCLDERERQRKRGGPSAWGISRSSPGDRSATPGLAIGVDPVGGI